MRAAIDTNLFVSSLLNPSGAPAQVVAAYRAGCFTLIASTPLLDELEKVLKRPKFARYFTPAAAAELIELLRSGAELVQVTGAIQLCRDPDDDALIEVAINGKANFLVTGDQDLLEPDIVAYLTAAGVHACSVSMFVRVLEEVRALQSQNLATDWEIEP